ncbi:GLPGLI family protein [Porphyromonas loveana]|uniref:GLPGLI family protein n=2 Tax=Porphyromonas loveana TaxID=1884669 RepID=UPI0035A1D37F
MVKFVSIAKEHYAVVLLSFLLVSITTPLEAQTHSTAPSGGMKLTYDQKPMGQASVECIYRYTRTNTKREKQSQRLILQANNKQSKCYSLAKYKLDSVANLRGRNNMKLADFQMLLTSYSEASIGDQSCYNSREYRDAKKAELTSFVYEFGPRNIEYTTPLPTVRWNTAHKERVTICGYSCRKATGEFGGRKWTVWYTTDIPVSSGPWKLGDLPGLILRASDATGEHSFEAVSIRNAKSTIFWDVFTTQKTTAEKARQMSRDKHKNYEQHERGFGVIQPNYTLLEP